MIDTRVRLRLVGWLRFVGAAERRLAFVLSTPVGVGLASFREMRHRRVSLLLDRVSLLTGYCLLVNWLRFVALAWLRFAKCGAVA